MVYALEVELPGRLLVEERAFLRVSLAHVHGAGRNGDVGPGTDPPLVAVLGLVNVGAPQHDDSDFVGMGMKRIDKAWIELREGAIRPLIVITPENLFLDSRDDFLELRFSDSTKTGSFLLWATATLSEQATTATPTTETNVA